VRLVGHVTLWCSSQRAVDRAGDPAPGRDGEGDRGGRGRRVSGRAAAGPAARAGGQAVGVFGAEGCASPRVCCSVAALLTGGNIDTASLGRCIDRGLACDRRLVRFSVTISDRPGGLGALIKLVESRGAGIKHVRHDRAWVKADLFSVLVSVSLPTAPFWCERSQPSAGEARRGDTRRRARRRAGKGAEGQLRRSHLRLDVVSYSVITKCSDTVLTKFI